MKRRLEEQEARRIVSRLWLKSRRAEIRTVRELVASGDQEGQKWETILIPEPHM